MKYRTHRDELSTCLIALLLATFILVTGNAPAQARGPAAKKIQQNGRPTISASDSRDLIGQFEFARHQQQRLELRNNPDLLAGKVAEAEDFLRRFPGRFRIEGRIEETKWVTPGKV